MSVEGVGGGMDLYIGLIVLLSWTKKYTQNKSDISDLFIGQIRVWKKTIRLVNHVF